MVKRAEELARNRMNRQVSRKNYEKRLRRAGARRMRVRRRLRSSLRVDVELEVDAPNERLSGKFLYFTQHDHSVFVPVAFAVNDTGSLEHGRFLMKFIVLDNFAIFLLHKLHERRIGFSNQFDGFSVSRIEEFPILDPILIQNVGIDKLSAP